MHFTESGPRCNKKQRLPSSWKQQCACTMFCSNNKYLDRIAVSLPNLKALKFFPYCLIDKYSSHIASKSFFMH